MICYSIELQGWARTDLWLYCQHRCLYWSLKLYAKSLARPSPQLQNHRSEHEFDNQPRPQTLATGRPVLRSWLKSHPRTRSESQCAARVPHEIKHKEECRGRRLLASEELKRARQKAPPPPPSVPTWQEEKPAETYPIMALAQKRPANGGLSSCFKAP